MSRMTLQRLIVRGDESLDRPRLAVVEQREVLRAQRRLPARDRERDLLDGDVGLGVGAVAEEEDVVRLAIAGSPAPRRAHRRHRETWLHRRSRRTEGRPRWPPSPRRRKSRRRRSRSPPAGGRSRAARRCRSPATSDGPWSRTRNGGRGSLTTISSSPTVVSLRVVADRAHAEAADVVADVHLHGHRPAGASLYFTPLMNSASRSTGSVATTGT